MTNPVNDKWQMKTKLIEISVYTVYSIEYIVYSIEWYSWEVKKSLKSLKDFFC